jgi:hypothetical protein
MYNFRYLMPFLVFIFTTGGDWCGKPSTVLALNVIKVVKHVSSHLFGCYATGHLDEMYSEI